LDFSNNYEPLKILEKLIFKRRLRKEFSLGLDIAASSFFKNEKYAFEGKTLKGEQLMRIYLSYFLSLKSLISLEDPFAEKEPVEFYKLREMVPQKWIVGDDLTVTNPRLVEKYAQEKVINAVIIKPVQNGTVSGTCQAIQTARNQKLKTIVSHRSGETEDVFILHLAKACSADGVKIGAPCRERIYKFNELVRLYD
jgi:enolase